MLRKYPFFFSLSSAATLVQSLRHCSTITANVSDTHFAASPLNAPATGIPATLRAEHAGAFKPTAFSSTAAAASFSNLLLQSCSTTLPQSDEMWQAPGAAALETVADHAGYHETLRYIKEHGHFFLVPKAIAARDAPLPHIAYADIMLALTECSMQRPPEEQFQLPGPVLRMLLCKAAHHILHDRAYFQTVERWFRVQLERQQSLGGEAWSAWIMCCAAANRIDLALLFLQHLQQQHDVQQSSSSAEDAKRRFGFDPVVFNYMMHPSEMIETESGAPNQFAGTVLGMSRGFLQQQRVLNDIQTSHGVVAAGVHAMFIFYALTHQPVQQWETIRSAIQQQQQQQQQQQHEAKNNSKKTSLMLSDFVSPRTLAAVKSVFEHERGRRCGPLTCRALVQLFAEARDMLQTCRVLNVLREREVEEQLVPVVFSRREQQRVGRFFFFAETSEAMQKQQQQAAITSSARQEQDHDENELTFSTKKQNNSNRNDDDDASLPSSAVATTAPSTFQQEQDRQHLPLLHRLLNADYTDPMQRNLPPLPIPSSAITSSGNDAALVPENKKKKKLIRRKKVKHDPSSPVQNFGASVAGDSDASLSEEEKKWQRLVSNTTGGRGRDPSAAAAAADSGSSGHTTVFASKAQIQNLMRERTARAFSGVTGGGGDSYAAAAAEHMLTLATAKEREKAEERELQKQAQEAWYKL